MAYQPTEGSNSAFSAGVNHVSNPGRSNVGGITMPGGNVGADEGLQGDSDRWNGLTPHGVVSTAAGASSSIDYEGMQRLAGNFNSPGAFGKLQDQLAGGSDSSQIAEE
jgi:hypothetical protein